MGSSLCLGRIAGIRIDLHWSVMAIWWLLTWSLASTMLPDQAPGYTSGLYWLAASMAAATLLGCLLAHELSHALVAGRHGVATEAITLWVFGGVASLKDQASSPHAELAISGAGPATSAGLAAGFGGLAAAFNLLSAPRLLVAALAWLAVVNLVLAMFNLLPGIPLDGGRVFQAVAWWITGDRPLAARLAVGAGKVLGYGLVGLGLFEVMAGYFTGLWLLFIGWFLLRAATAEGTANTLRQALDQVLVGDAMTPDPDAAPDWISVQDLLDNYLLRYRHSTFPVHDAGGHPTGLVTLATVKSVAPAARPTTPASAIAIPMAEITTATVTEPLVDLLDRLATAREHRALVFDQREPTTGRLVGIVTPTDVTRMVEVSRLVAAR